MTTCAIILLAVVAYGIYVGIGIARDLDDHEGP